MPEFNRTRFLSETSAGGTTVQRYFGNECSQTLFTGWPKGRANQVRDLLNMAYQLGRTEMIKELHDLAGQDGGQFYVSVMLGTGEEIVTNPNEKNDDGSYVLDPHELRAWWAKVEAHLETVDPSSVRHDWVCGPCGVTYTGITMPEIQAHMAAHKKETEK